MAILQPFITLPAVQCKALPKRHSACKSLLKDGIGRCRLHLSPSGLYHVACKDASAVELYSSTGHCIYSCIGMKVCCKMRDMSDLARWPGGSAAFFPEALRHPRTHQCAFLEVHGRMYRSCLMGNFCRAGSMPKLSLRRPASATVYFFFDWMSSLLINVLHNARSLRVNTRAETLFNPPSPSDGINTLPRLGQS